jgi:hypothetical protein
VSRLKNIWKEVFSECWADDAAMANSDVMLLVVVTVIGAIATLSVIGQFSFDFWSLAVGML